MNVWHQQYHEILKPDFVLLCSSSEPRSCPQLTFLTLNDDKVVFANYAVHEPLKSLTVL